MLILTTALLVLATAIRAMELTSGWESGLYGQAMCVSIPANMGLCQNINYSQMKVPNLLGHETTTEIVEQSSAWTALLGIQCHADAQLFLCSLFAPICITQAPQTTIQPCRSLCEQVRGSCEAPMLSYNYPWPSMFNCSQFPEDNGLCIKPTNQESGRMQSQPQPTTAETTTTSTPEPIESSSTPTVFIHRRPNLSSNRQQCHAACDRQFNMSDVVSAYCSSRIVLRASLKSAGPAHNLRLKSRQTETGQLGSQHLVIPRRDRRFFKGARILFNTVGPFLTEDNLARYFQQQSLTEFSPRKDLDFYLLSRQQFNLIRNRRRKVQRSTVEPTSDHCQCNLLQQQSHRRKYLVTAQVVRARQSLFQSPATRFPRSLFQSRVRQVRFHRTHFRLVKVTGLFEWTRVRPFVDYLDNFYLDKSAMCRDVAATVAEIIKSDAMFF
jgi:hypothetical protein